MHVLWLIWHFLLIHNFLNMVVASSTAFLMGIVLSYLPLKKHVERQKDHTAKVAAVADNLNTTTPGGLRDIVLMLKHISDKLDKFGDNS